MSESKYDSKYDEEDIEEGAKGFQPIPPKVGILDVQVDPAVALLAEPFRLKIRFELDRDCIGSTWRIRFLVDSGFKRIIKVRDGKSFSFSICHGLKL